jgi:hypothetical protein
VLVRGDAATTAAGVAEDVDAVLRHCNVRPTDIRLVRTDDNGVRQEISVGARPTAGAPDAFRSLNQLYAAYAAGTSMVLGSLHDYWPPVTALRSALEEELGHPVCVNLYMTPRGARAFGAHFDPHDVLILQVEGTKHWRIWESCIELPLAEQKVDISEAQAGELRHELDLMPGDLLYIPRGVAHEARTTPGASSVHLTVALYTYKWVDLLHEALDSAARGDAQLRRSLPVALSTADPERLGRELARLLRRAASAGDGDEALARLANRFISVGTAGARHFAASTRPPAGSGHPATAAPRHGLPVVENNGSVSIQFPGNQVAPGQHRPRAALHRHQPRFAVSELPQLSEARDSCRCGGWSAKGCSLRSPDHRVDQSAHSCHHVEIAVPCPSESTCRTTRGGTHEPRAASSSASPWQHCWSGPSPRRRRPPARARPWCAPTSPTRRW